MVEEIPIPSSLSACSGSRTALLRRGDYGGQAVTRGPSARRGLRNRLREVGSSKGLQSAGVGLGLRTFSCLTACKVAGNLFLADLMFSPQAESLSNTQI